MQTKQWLGRAVVAAAILLSGCASMESHDKLATQMQAAQTAGGPAAALKALEDSATTADARGALLYNLERGELLRQDHRYADSTAAWLTADGKVNEWEQKAKTSPDQLMGMVGAALISERLKTYEGQDYEKVWLTTRLAMNRIAAKDWDNARVDIKRTHEREAVIAEFRAKETAAAEAAAKSKGATATGKELNGYPVETLNDPEVLQLRNGYQNALSHYLAGFLYEVLDESGLAAPGYRKAIELKPGSSILEEGLRGLDARTSFTHRRRQRMTDVLFVIEAGNAPARKPRQFIIPIPINNRLNSISVSYPVIEAAREPVPAMLGVGTINLPTAPVVDMNVMARRALKDEMPGMVFRGITRAIAKGVVQDEAQKRGGAFAGLLVTVAAAATEQADDRMWRTLPGMVAVARGYLPEGEHRLMLDGRDSGTTVLIQGQYALVPVQIRGTTVSLGDVASFGHLSAPAQTQTATAPVVVPAASVVPVGTKASSRPATAAATSNASRSVKTTAVKPVATGPIPAVTPAAATGTTATGTTATGTTTTLPGKPAKTLPTTAR